MSKAGLIAKLKVAFANLSSTETSDTKATQLGGDIYDETSDNGEVGEIKIFPFSSVPSGYLECDGSAISRTTYASLFAIIGETHGEGNGTTTFNIPDYRGKFFRAWDHGAGNDPDAASRTAQATGGNTGDNIGSIQADEYESHQHQTYWGQNGAGDLYPETPYISNVYGGGAHSVSASGGNETRPINTYIMPCIKYL